MRNLCPFLESIGLGA